MRGEHRILTFGLTADENEVVRANVPARDYEVFDTDAPTDLIAISGVATIIRASVLDDDGMGILFDYYTQINGCTDETVIWLGAPKPPKELQKFFKCYPSFADVGDKLKYLLLSAQSRCRKASEYSEKLVNGLLILSIIRKKPGVSTKTLSEELRLPVRSVQRYIGALQAAGEWIEYDRTRKGWKLFQGISVLFGDPWDGEWK